VKKERSKTHFHLLLTRHVLSSEGNSWKNRKFVSGIKEKKISKDFKTRDLTFFSLPLLSVKKKLKKNTHRELRKLDLERLSIKKEHLRKFKERELRF
jgi:hypothetical protein